jgi:hypothetical protein
MVLSDPIVAELREKLIEKFNVPQEDADAAVDHLRPMRRLFPHRTDRVGLSRIPTTTSSSTPL